MDVRSHEYMEKMRGILSESPYFNAHFLKVWEPSKAVIDLIYEDSKWRRFLPEKDLYLINQGHCSEFARDIVEKCPGASLEFSRNHYYVSYICEDGTKRFFDAETPHGVDYEMNLPIYQRERKKYNRNKNKNKRGLNYEGRSFW